MPVNGVLIMQTEVTEEMYEREGFVVPPPCNVAMITECPWTDGTCENRPVVCIGAVPAKDFCFQIGGRLPTDAEWEAAAFGVKPDPSEANDYWWTITSLYENQFIRRSVTGKGLDVNGIYGLWGNAAEWTGTVSGTGSVLYNARGAVATNGGLSFPLEYFNPNGLNKGAKVNTGFRCVRDL